MTRPLLATLLCLTLATAAWAQLPLPRPEPGPPPLRGHVDWQGHPAMHVPTFGVFAPPFGEVPPSRGLTWRHMLRQTVYAPYLRRSGTRVFVAAAVAAERTTRRDRAFALIEEQLATVERFVAANPDTFALARSPAEARRLLTTTDKVVVVHSIEGMARVLDGPEDARYWADRGVVVATLIHLREDEFGSAGLTRGLASAINPRGMWRDLWGLDRGLTAHGEQAIAWLADAGVLVDLTHMHPASIDDALRVCRQQGIPPLVTHGMLRAITDTQRGFSDAQVLEVYRLGGTFALPISGAVLKPHDPREPLPAGYRSGTLDAFQLHAETLQRLIAAHAGELVGRPGAAWADLSEAERTRLSFGWSSDWNGFVNHSRPTGDGPLEVDRVGLAHPGLLPQYWQRLTEQGLDLDPLLRAPEAFLSLWERVRARR